MADFTTSVASMFRGYFMTQLCHSRSPAPNQSPPCQNLPRRPFEFVFDAASQPRRPASITRRMPGDSTLLS